MSLSSLCLSVAASFPLLNSCGEHAWWILPHQAASLYIPGPSFWLIYSSSYSSWPDSSFCSLCFVVFSLFVSHVLILFSCAPVSLCLPTCFLCWSSWHLPHSMQPIPFHLHPACHLCLWIVSISLLTCCYTPRATIHPFQLEFCIKPLKLTPDFGCCIWVSFCVNHDKWGLRHISVANECS